MKNLVPFLLTVGLATSLGCGSPDSGPDPEHREAKQRWETNRPVDYTYEFRRTCFCVPDSTRPVTVWVSGEQVIDVTYVDDQTQVPEQDWDRYPTIPGLFEKIEEALAEGADEVSVIYDEDAGYPTDIYIDHSRAVADEETDWMASNLEALLSI